MFLKAGKSLRQIYFLL